MTEDYMLPYKVEEQLEYKKWAKEIPPIKFPSDWYVKSIPPFGGAIVRFIASLNTDDPGVSVYLDCYDRLGIMGQPYWEAYPIKGDIFRCYLKETDKLIEEITKELHDKAFEKANTPRTWEQGYLAGYKQAIQDAVEVVSKHWFKHSVVSGVVESIAKDIKKLGKE